MAGGKRNTGDPFRSHIWEEEGLEEDQRVQRHLIAHAKTVKCGQNTKKEYGGTVRWAEPLLNL